LINLLFYLIHTHFPSFSMPFLKVAPSNTFPLLKLIDITRSSSSQVSKSFFYQCILSPCEPDCLYRSSCTPQLRCFRSPLRMTSTQAGTSSSSRNLKILFAHILILYQTTPLVMTPFFPSQTFWSFSRQQYTTLFVGDLPLTPSPPPPRQQWDTGFFSLISLQASLPFFFPQSCFSSGAVHPPGQIPSPPLQAKVPPLLV